MSYKFPLKGRKSRVKFLLGHESHWDDDARVYYRFAWNVKLYHLNLDFDHLLKIYKARYRDGELPREYTDETWLGLAREAYEGRENNLEDVAVEAARDTVLETEAYEHLDDGTRVKVKYSFIGRSGGHLALTSYDGLTLDVETFEAALEDGSLSDEDVDKLYRLVVMLDKDFGPGAAVEEVEYQAAGILFEGWCDDIPLEPLPSENLGAGI